jgi:hypothetical protein
VTHLASSASVSSQHDWVVGHLVLIELARQYGWYTPEVHSAAISGVVAQSEEQSNRGHGIDTPLSL